MEKGWNLDQCPSDPGTSLSCHVVLVELKALSLFLHWSPNEVPSPSQCEVSEDCRAQHAGCYDVSNELFYYEEMVLRLLSANYPSVLALPLSLLP